MSENLHANGTDGCGAHSCCGSRAGSLVALYFAGAVHDVKILVLFPRPRLSSQRSWELAEMEVQNERLALAELRALRAKISGHFIYHALAAVAALIRSIPEEARELLAEFAALHTVRVSRPTAIRHAGRRTSLHRRVSPTGAGAVGDRLKARVRVAPEVLGAVVPALSVQPLVENAVRHGVETTRGTCRLEILGADLNSSDVELCVRDDGPGMTPEAARRALQGRSQGIGLVNVRLRACRMLSARAMGYRLSRGSTDAPRFG